MIEIPYGRQCVDDDDIAAVVDILRGDWLTQGPAIDQFESALCAVTGAEHAVAFANGTVALHASLWATGIGKGDTVATSPLSFVASASCALWVERATVVHRHRPEDAQPRARQHRALRRTRGRALRRACRSTSDRS